MKPLTKEMQHMDNQQQRVTMTEVTQAIYAIIDLKAEMLIGGLMLFKHDAAAIRMFDDVARMDHSAIARHPEDFELVLVGFVDDEGNITPDRKLVLSGKQWAAVHNTDPANAG